jgi:hypothetical protein
MMIMGRERWRNSGRAVNLGWMVFSWERGVGVWLGD